LPVVSEVMQHAMLLDAADIASWTPLHIAAHMNRREAAARLLRARATPHCRNARGQTPADLCMDHGTLELLRGCVPLEGSASSGARPGGTGNSIEDDSVGIPSRCEPECFFVNPAPIIRATVQHRKALLQIAALIFNMRPSYGLAFAVVSGLVDSYTGAMRIFLQHGGACRVQLGGFLGEAFSLCTLIRFSVFDSMPLLHTGALSALSRAFCVLQLPEDLQKIDRLVRGLAHVWWRKHKALAEGLADSQTPAQQLQMQLNQQRQALSLADAAASEVEQPEYVGLELWQYLAGSDALCQLMLSTVLLHWYVHSNGSGSGRSLQVETWVVMNRGIEGGGGDVPEHVQRRIHAAVCKGFRQELTLASPGARPFQPDRGLGGRSSPIARIFTPGSPSKPLQARCRVPPSETAAGPGASLMANTSLSAISPPAQPSAAPPAVASRDGATSPLPGPVSTPLSVCASAEGWVHLLDGVLQCPEIAAREGTCERTAMAGFAQDLALPNYRGHGSADLNSAAPGGVGPVDAPAAASAAAATMGVAAMDGAVWASLCCIFLFFAGAPGSTPSSAPYTFTDARNIRVANVNSETCVITLQGVPGKGAPEGQQAPLVFVMLLSDGRWQEVQLPKLDIKVGNSEELQFWVSNLVQWPANQHVSSV